MVTLDAVQSKKHLPYGGARAVNHPEAKGIICRSIGYDMVDDLDHPRLIENYIDCYSNWLDRYHPSNQFIGLEQFQIRTPSQGTTEAFDKWYIKHSGRRLRVFRGEYMYHYATYRNAGLPFQWIDDEPIRADDTVIISMPFADHGGIHPDTMKVLDQCELLGVPVLIDSAYYHVCYGIAFDFSHPAIQEVAFSLSKTLPIAGFRVGMRLARFDTDDGLEIYRKTRYLNVASLSVGFEVMASSINHVDLLDNMIQEQRILCNEMGIECSSTALFGIGGDDWNLYNRGGMSNRLFLGKEIESRMYGKL